MPCVETMRKEMDKNRNPIPLIAGAMVAGGAKKAGQTAYAVTEEVAPEVFEAGADMVYGIMDKMGIGGGEENPTLASVGKAGLDIGKKVGSKGLEVARDVAPKVWSGAKSLGSKVWGKLKQNPAVGEKVLVDFGNGDVEVTIVEAGKVKGFWVVNSNGQKITVPESAIYEISKGDDMKRYEDYQVPELEQNPPQAKDINNNENIIVPMEQVREWAFALANGQTRNAKFPVGFIPDDENCPKMNPDEGQVEITLITPTDGKCWKCADAGCEVCQVPKHNPQEVKPAPVEVSPIGEKAVISENPSPNPPLNKKWLSNEFTGLLITPKIGLEKVKKYKSKFIKFWNNADEATKKYFQERLAKRPTEIQNAVKAWMNIKANPGENMITDVVVNGTGVETQLQNVSEVLIVNPPEEAKVEITPVAPVVVPTVVEAPVVAPVVETPIVPVVENPPLPPQPVQMTCEHELKYLGKGNPKKGGKTLDVYKCQKCKKNYVWSV